MSKMATEIREITELIDTMAYRMQCIMCKTSSGGGCRRIWQAGSLVSISKEQGEKVEARLVSVPCTNAACQHDDRQSCSIRVLEEHHCGCFASTASQPKRTAGTSAHNHFSLSWNVGGKESLGIGWGEGGREGERPTCWCALVC